MTFEQALRFLSNVATKELPKHLARIPGGAHSIVIPAFIRGVGPRVYTIDNVFNVKTKEHFYRYTSRQRTHLPASPPPRLTMGGTGGLYLHEKPAWKRELLSLVNANDREKVSDYAIADHLARLNYEAHQKVADGTVGPRCIVAWRRRPDRASGRQRGGGAHQFYTGTDRDKNMPAIPSIVNGFDAQALAEHLMSAMQGWNPKAGADPGTIFGVDRDEMNRRLAEIPSEPDEELR
jgi:hypothetical protein